MRISATSRRIALSASLLALSYLPFVAGRSPGAGIAGAALLGAAGLVAPGAAGILAFGARSAAGRTVAGLLAAGLLHGATILVRKGLGVEPTPAIYAAILGAVTVLSGALAAALRRGPVTPRLPPAATAAALAAFVLFAFGGTRVVPPLEDQDFEVQATANGLVRDLSPVCLTNRSRLHFFAHPPLLHVLAAGTLTLAGELETVRPAYDVAKEELAKLPRGEPERGLAAALRAFRERPPVKDRYYLWATRVKRRFLKEPALDGTRAPDFVLGAVVVVLVLAGAGRRGASPADALLVAAVYATLPEVFVRSSYGGYYAVSAATMLAAASLAAGRRGGARAGVAAGALSTLANHKAVVLGAGVVAYRALARVVTRGTQRLGPAVPVTLGMVAGLAAFWIWGLALAPADFVGEHVLDHGLRRFAGGEALTPAGHPFYPSRAGVWLQFARHMGWLWTAMAAAGLAAALPPRRHARVVEPGAPGDLARILAAWVIAGAIAFTATDWRQTKHLCLLVPALSLLVAGLLPRVNVPVRRALRLALVFSLGWNVVWIVRLARDFGSLRVTPLW